MVRRQWPITLSRPDALSFSPSTALIAANVFRPKTVDVFFKILGLIGRFGITSLYHDEDLDEFFMCLMRTHPNRDSEWAVTVFVQSAANARRCRVNAIRNRDG